MYQRETNTSRYNTQYGYPLPKALQKPKMNTTYSHPLVPPEENQNQTIQKESFSVCKSIHAPSPQTQTTASKHLPCFLHNYR